MIESLDITNYRSIRRATVPLRPFTILVGANGSGKTNLLHLLVDLGARRQLTPHFNAPKTEPVVAGQASAGSFRVEGNRFPRESPPELQRVKLFNLNPNAISSAEDLKPSPEVLEDGTGAVRVLDSLKSGDREDLFDTIEARLREFVPEIEKLSFVPNASSKQLQVRERHVRKPVPMGQLSEGTRLILTMLTIVYQERKPTLICLEEIDRALHPQLFGQLLEVCRAIVAEPGGPQIVATTHNPYFVDQFLGDEDGVLIVEKTNAETSFVTLRERMTALGPATDTLGGTWYSGLVGGVPKRDFAHAHPPPATK